MKEQPENCSAGGYCDCLRKLIGLGYWTPDNTFLALSLTQEQASVACDALTASPPGCHDFEALLTLTCREYLERHAELDEHAELVELRQAVAKMSHRKCRDCGNIAYHLDTITPHVLCEKCGSQDTRLIRPLKVEET